MLYPAPPEYSDDSEDGFSDDGGYEDVKVKIKTAHLSNINNLTPEELEKREKDRKLTLLFNAITYGNLNACIEEIEKGLGIDVDLQSGWTPLLLACAHGQPNIVRELIKRGANVNSARDGCTALMLACNCPNYTSSYPHSMAVIEFLIESGADPNVTNRKRMNALMFAASNGHLQAVKYLLPLSDTESRDNQGWSALFWAINFNHVSVVKYLLDEGLDYSKTDVRGYTPLELAKSNDFDTIMELFPEEDNDAISTIIINSNLNVLENCDTKKPRFFLDICNMLCAMRNEPVIKVLHEENISLVDFLSFNNEDLKKLGVVMPYQRNRILNGLHRFHKHPYHPKSLFVVKVKELYSNIDVATQMLTSIKQFIAMEASFKYILKNKVEIEQAELYLIEDNICKIRSEIKSIQCIVRRILLKTKDWDSQLQPADLITKASRRYRVPWRKLLLGVALTSLVVYRYLK